MKLKLHSNMGGVCYKMYSQLVCLRKCLSNNLLIARRLNWYSNSRELLSLGATPDALRLIM
jgi:hypothetical protein